MTGLADFANSVIQTAFEGGSLDGGEIQELAVEHGLLIETTFDPKKHTDLEGCAEKGDPWFVPSALLKSAK